MAIEILHDRYNTVAIMFCNTSDWAFGPVVRSEEHVASEELELFVNWLPLDAREFTDADLESRYAKFRDELKHCDCGMPFLDGGELCPSCATE